MSRTIFISYASSEKALVEGLAAFLEKGGYEVWWDAHLLAGEQFRNKIDEQLDDCAVAIVIWTPTSVKSKWVIAEAEHADRLGKLVTARSPNLDPIRIPKPFGVYHAEQADNFQGIEKAIRELLHRRRPSLELEKPRVRLSSEEHIEGARHLRATALSEQDPNRKEILNNRADLVEFLAKKSKREGF